MFQINISCYLPPVFRRNGERYCFHRCLFTLGGYLPRKVEGYLPWIGRWDTYLGWGEGVPTFDWGGGTYLKWGRGYLPWMRRRVPTLGWGRGTYLGRGRGTYLGWGDGYLPWIGRRGYLPWTAYCCGRCASCDFLVHTDFKFKQDIHRINITKYTDHAPFPVPCSSWYLADHSDSSYDPSGTGVDEHIAFPRAMILPGPGLDEHIAFPRAIILLGPG